MTNKHGRVGLEKKLIFFFFSELLINKPVVL